MKRLCYILVLFTMLLGTSVYAEEKSKPLWGFIDSVGFDWGYYKDEWFPTDFVKSDECANTVNRFSIRAESSKILPWEKWIVGMELGYSMHKADELPDGCYSSSHDAGFREYNINLIVKRKMFDNLFYFGGLAGVGYWYQRDNGMHNLGDSHVLGSWGALVGKDWHIYKTWSFRTEVRATHTSDPFESDMGKNYIGWVAGITKNF